MYQAPMPEEAAYPPPRPIISTNGYIAAGVIIAIEAVVIVVGLLLGGEFSTFAQTGLQYGAFIPLALLAQIGEQELWAKVLSYLYALGLQTAVGLLALIYYISAAFPGLTTGNIASESWLGLLGLFVIMLVLFAICSAVLLRPVRVFLARWLPINPDSLAHTLTLWIVFFIILSAYTQLVYLGGRPPLLTALQSGALPEDALAGTSQSLSLLYGLAWMIPLALIGAGWPLKRSIGASMERLGLVRPTVPQILGGIGGAVVLAIVVSFAGGLISQVFQFIGLPETDSATFDKLLGGVINPVGAVIVGFTAGLGEELAVRGLLQPRLGILVSNLGFTAVHAYQYGFDALLVVFVLGLLLGIVRSRTNTTTSAIMHGTYDCLLLLASWAATQGMLGS